MTENYSIFKCVFVGAVDVGKTALTQMYYNNTIVHNYEVCLRLFQPTIGVDFQIKTLQIDGYNIKLQIWDVSGQDRFRAIVPSYLRAAHLAFIVYDVTNRNSFDTVEIKLQQLALYAPPNCIKILIANKIDQQQRIISTEQGYELAQRRNLHYFETTATQPEYIENVFNFFLKDQINLGKLMRNKLEDIQFNVKQKENNELKQKIIYYQDLSLIFIVTNAIFLLLLLLIVIFSNLFEIVPLYIYSILICLGLIFLYYQMKYYFI